MSLPVIYLINDCAEMIGDPNKVRVTLGQWTLFYNQSCRELCQKAKVLKFRARFNLGPQAQYHYPDERTVVTKVEANETPDDDNTWFKLDEMFEDEFAAQTSRFYPSATTPSHYFADVDGFYLYPRPEAAITNGGRVTYFGLPDRIFDANTANFQLPELAQDYVIRRMVIHGMKARNRMAEAEGELKLWNADIEGLQDSMEDPSDDRRSAIRPRRSGYGDQR